MPLERYINIAVNGCSGFTASTQKGPFMAMWISCSRGNYLIWMLRHLGNSTCRSAKLLPKQGDKSPWRGGVNYIVDMIRLAVGGLRTDSLEFTHLPKPNPPPTLPVRVELDPLSSIIRSAGKSRSVGGGGGSVSLRCRIPEENHYSEEESRTH